MLTAPGCSSPLPKFGQLTFAANGVQQVSLSLPRSGGLNHFQRLMMALRLDSFKVRTGKSLRPYIWRVRIVCIFHNQPAPALIRLDKIGGSDETLNELVSDDDAATSMF